MTTPIYIIIPLAGLATGLVFGLYAMYTAHRQRAMWHETARLALEKGQPLPALLGDDLQQRPAGQVRTGRDARSGLILMAIGVGLAVFFRTVGFREAMGVGAIPGFIGLALFLYGAFSPRRRGTEELPPRT